MTNKKENEGKKKTLLSYIVDFFVKALFGKKKK